MPKSIEERREAEAAIGGRYQMLEATFNERSRRLFCAGEAVAFGYGGVSAVQRATGMARSVVRRGMNEVKAIESAQADVLPKGRLRRPGAGRKRATEKDPTLLPDLKKLVEPTTRGEPESPLLWTARSHRNRVKALGEMGHKVSKWTVPKLLKELGYSLQGNKKRLEGSQHPDRNAQFEHIAETVRRQLEANEPAISVDTKKKELVGNYKNDGRELRPKNDAELVNGHDFPDPEKGKVAPYGVYDLAANEAWVSVGISHDTGEFAVQTIRTWWLEMGRSLYPNATSILITADGGGSNGYRLRLWKVELQKLADELGIVFRICHLPPGTSKWNKIEHRLFSFITKNWRGKPLVTHQVIVELIAATTTREGLKVMSRIDERIYPTGWRISDREMAEICLVPDKFHAEWNYAIEPHPTNESTPSPI